MNASFLQHPPDIILIRMEQFPPFKKHPDQDIASQIAKHLTLVLRTFKKEASPVFEVPSAITLASFYQCTILDVLDGLYALRKNQAYEYIMNGLDAEIHLVGTTLIQKSVKRLPKWLYPWESTHKLAEAPLPQLFHDEAE